MYDKNNKINNERRVWFATQGATLNPKQGMKYLWAPSKGKDHRSKLYWDNVLKVKKGDIIFNYSTGLKGISIALSDGYNSNNEDPDSPWGKSGYRVDIQFNNLEPLIKSSEIIKIKNELFQNLQSITNKPFNYKGGVNQGYLYELTMEAGKLLYQLHNKPINNPLIDEFFNEVKINTIKKNNLLEIPFDVKKAFDSLSESGLTYSFDLFTKFIASLLTKPFVILTGLSGSGKTKLAQAFVQWLCEDENQYRIIPVGADWTNRDPLLGYSNSLKPEVYVKPDNKALDLILDASENKDLPYFLILDEMNLSHVERYFSDFLSTMESKEAIPLHANEMSVNRVPGKLNFPPNLFIIGTVNIDETTNMFSPKVLDRANTIEFRVTKNEMEEFFSNIKDINMEILKGKGAIMSRSFLEMARRKEFPSDKTAEINSTLIQFFETLKKVGAEFGYRSASEMHRLINQLTVLNTELTTIQKTDIAIMQKLLPKLHGSRRKLCPVLETLGLLCIRGNVKIISDVFENVNFDYDDENVLYPLSLEKIARMYRGAIDNGFASFAEA